MKKIIALVALATVVSTSSFAQESTSRRQPGGIVGGCVGCCFGLRAAADYNDGKDIHWREWGKFIPYAGIIFQIWDFLDGMNGVTRDEIRKNYGANFF